MRKYAVLILSHGRADNVKTFNSLRVHGYTGDIYIVVDDEDAQREKYLKNFGDKVVIFCKKDAASYTDFADTKQERDVVVFARNTCHKIAKDLGLTHFIEMDDDYGYFGQRKESGKQLLELRAGRLDEIFEAMFDFLDISGAYAIAPAQGGDYIGGKQGKTWRDRITRKCMNAFFCRTDKPFQFYGRLNEDTTAYTYLAQKGFLFFTIADWMLNQQETQKQKGGLTDAYLRYGTYVKSFYSVMYSPSCVKVGVLASGTGTHTAHYRIHHKVNYGKCCPQIISCKYKK